MQTQTQSSDNPTMQMLKRFGIAGFTFFFLKGMLWLTLPMLARALWLH